MNVFVLLNTKEDIMKNMGNRAVLDHIYIKKILLWKSIVPQNSLVTNFLQNIFLMLSRTNTFIQIWNYLRMSKWWYNFGVIFFKTREHIMFLWLSGRALHYRSKRLWVQFPGNTRTDKNKCITWMHCKSLWIKTSAKCKCIAQWYFHTVVFYVVYNSIV